MAKMVAAVETMLREVSVVTVLGDIKFKRVTTDSQLDTTLQDKSISATSTLVAEATPYKILTAQEISRVSKKTYAIQ